MIAHQWRQPLATLNTIFGKVKMLKELNMLDDNKLNENISKSENLVLYLSDTINDFRNFFKQDDSKKDHISFEKLLKKPTEIFQTDLKGKRIDLEISIDEQLQGQKITIHSSKMAQVVINLVKNAYDALVENNPEEKYIKLAVVKQEDNIIITSEDSAGGIPKDIIDKIFDPYFSTKSLNGTGLGLYMSKMIIEDHIGGTISVENKNKGAKFTITIPLK